MKFLDKVKLIKDNKYYNNCGIYKGRIGTIISEEIRDGDFEVVFIDEKFLNKNYVWKDENIDNIKEDIFLEVAIEDLELVESSNITDEEILNGLPKHDPRWWCKVEDGYILNLLGEKKNKIPYDYKS